MDNTCNYSDNWQPYINDYDKLEYDIKLKDGTIVENCYPNGGIFNSISKEHNGQSFEEANISEIRFSQNPQYGLNHNVSKADQNKSIGIKMMRDAADHIKALPGGVIVPVRTEPKIGRNDICPKCDSGLKYKKCCGSPLIKP